MVVSKYIVIAHILAVVFLLGTTGVQAKCLFSINSKLSAQRNINNGSFWAMNKVLSEKGFSKTTIRKKANILIEISIDLERNAKSNLMTGVKDFFDGDHETDYMMKYKQTTHIKVLSDNKRILSASLFKSGSTIRSFNEHDREIADAAVIDAAKILESLLSCLELN